MFIVKEYILFTLREGKDVTKRNLYPLRHGPNLSLAIDACLGFKKPLDER